MFEGLRLLLYTGQKPFSGILFPQAAIPPKLLGIMHTGHMSWSPKSEGMSPSSFPVSPPAIVKRLLDLHSFQLHLGLYLCPHLHFPSPRRQSSKGFQISVPCGSTQFTYISVLIHFLLPHRQSSKGFQVSVPSSSTSVYISVLMFISCLPTGNRQRGRRRPISPQPVL